MIQGVHRSQVAACCSPGGFNLPREKLMPCGSQVFINRNTFVPVDDHGPQFDVDLNSVRGLISPRTKVIVVSHLFGPG